MANHDRVNEVYSEQLFDAGTQQALRERVHWMCAQVRGRDVLDIGCSQGIVTLLLGREGFKVMGVDIEAEAIAYAQAELQQEPSEVQARVSFIHADAASFAFEPASFDSVILGEVLEHLVQPERLLAAACRAVKAGGRIILTTPFGVFEHADHKQTYYLSSFLSLVTPFAQPVGLEIMGKRICFVGEKGEAAEAGANGLAWEELLEKSEQAFLGIEETFLAERKQRAADFQKQAARVGEVQERLQTIQGQLGQVQTEKAQLQQKSATVVAEREAIQTELRGRLEQVEAAKASEGREWRAQLAAAKEQAGKSEAVQAELREQVQRAEVERAELAAVQSELRAQLTAVEAAKASEGRELRGQLAAAKEQAGKSEAAQAKLTAQLQRAEVERAELTAVQTELRAQLAAAKEQAGKSEAVQAELREQIQRAEVERAELATVQSELRGQLAAAQQTAEQLEAEKAEQGQVLSEQLAAVQQTAEQLEAQQAELTGKVHRAERERTQLAAVQTELQERLEAEQQKAEQLEVARGELTKQVQELETTKRALGVARNEIEKTLTETQRSANWYQRSRDKYQYSTRYRLGDALLSALRPSRQTLLLPFTLYRVFRGSFSRAKGKNGTGVQPSTLPSVEKPTEQKPQGQLKAKPEEETQTKTCQRSNVTQSNDLRTQLLLSGIIDAPLPLKKLKLACILDVFSSECFTPECELIPFRPDNWREILGHTPPDLLFVESAWRGNDNSWRLKIGNYWYPHANELKQLVSWCREKKIPTVFWNKEDPVYFEHFIADAQLFDYVFTTDANCLEKYRQQLGHNRVFSLPFAAQPDIHHPTRVPGYQAGAVCFAGSYYTERFPERNKGLSILLNAAKQYKLTIYDRNAGVDDPSLHFPQEFQPFVAGNLPYDQMVHAYKHYKIFLNVNSVTDSPTMFSRRVFELLASGTPVLSNESQGMREMLGHEIVPIASTLEEAKTHLSQLLGDESLRQQLALQGLRTVMNEHTYTHRLYTLATTVGLQVQMPSLPAISLVALITRDTDVDRVVKIFHAQQYQTKELLFVLSPQVTEAIHTALATLTGPNCRVLPGEGTAAPDWHRQLVSEASGEFLCFLQEKDYYGPHFLLDLALATRYTTASIIGKRSYYRCNPDGQVVGLIRSGEEYCYTNAVRLSAALIRKNVCTLGLTDQLLDLDESTSYMQAWLQAGAHIYATDRFNYCSVGDRSMSTETRDPLCGKDWASVMI